MPLEIGADCTVVEESMGASWQYTRADDSTRCQPSTASLVAREFFAAHPEPKPKPWQRAKDGEVWTVGVGGGYHAECVPVIQGQFVHAIKGAVRVWALDDPAIDYGEKVWPES